LKKPIISRYRTSNKRLRIDKYDYGARFYDPQIGRWTTPDPLSETLQEPYTPYQYCLNNPVLHTDPDGKIVPLLAARAIKGAVAAVVDVATQVAVSYATNGGDIGEAFKKVDLVSAGGAFVTGALTIPGFSTAVKASVTVGTAVIDAAVDYEVSGEKRVVGGDKPLVQAGADLVLGGIGSLKAETHIPGLKGGTPAAKNEIKIPDLIKPASEKQISSIKPDAGGIVQGATVGNNGVVNAAVKENTEKR
jgi:RHS repeat-associated protein